MSKELPFDISQGIALITINRPGFHNSLSAEVIEGIGAAYRRCDEDGRSVPGGEVLRTALAVGLHQHLLWRGLDTPLPELAELESRAFNRSMTKQDAVEGGSPSRILC